MDWRLRERLHFGSPMENKYALMQFDIHTEAFLQERRQKEAQCKQLERQARTYNSRFAEYPEPKDVLMGRGKPYQSIVVGKCSFFPIGVGIRGRVHAGTTTSRQDGDCPPNCEMNSRRRRRTISGTEREWMGRGG